LSKVDISAALNIALPSNGFLVDRFKCSIRAAYNLDVLQPSSVLQNPASEVKKVPDYELK